MDITKKKIPLILNININKFKCIYLYQCMFSKEKYIVIQYNLSDSDLSDNDSDWEKIENE
jgi:hypothetical protein